MTGAESVSVGWSSVITWGIVLLGWLAVHHATLARERRKERREAVHKAIEALRQVEADALEFHTAASFNGVTADQLVYQTNRIIRSLQRTPLGLLDLPLGRMVKVRKAVTLTADPSAFTTQAPGSQLLRDIRAAIDDLVDAIEAARDEHWA